MANKIKALKGNTGGILTGEEFFGREKELRLFKQLLIEEQRSLLIPGPRRWGKTNFVKKFIALNKKNYPLIYTIIQDCHSLASLRDKIVISLYDKKRKLFVWDVFKLKSKKTVKKAASYVDKIYKLKLKSSEEKPEEILNDLNSLFKKAARNRVVIFLDEFADFLLNLEKREGLQNVKLFLAWLREQQDEKNVRMVITSSINILSTLKRMGADDLMTNVKTFHLPPLTKKEVLRFFKGLLLYHKIEVEDETDRFILEKQGSGVHIHIQLFADAVRLHFRKAPRKKLKTKQLKEIYEAIIQEDDPNLSVMHTRIDRKNYFGKKEKIVVLKILAILSSKPMSLADIFPLVNDMEKDKKSVKSLLERLIDEGYLIKKGTDYQFLSIFLKDWWFKKYSDDA